MKIGWSILYLAHKIRENAIYTGKTNQRKESGVMTNLPYNLKEMIKKARDWKMEYVKSLETGTLPRRFGKLKK